MSIQALMGVSQSGVPFSGTPGGRRPTPLPLDGVGDGSVATATLDAADIDRQLRSGESVAAVAAAKGVPAAKIIEAIMTLMLPNADSNGDIAERIALHRTAPVHHKVRKQEPVPDPVARHEAAMQDAALPGHAARVAQAQPAVPGTHNTTAITTNNLNATSPTTVIQSAVADHESLSTARSIDTYV
jgi:hypothetical protein